MLARTYMEIKKLKLSLVLQICSPGKDWRTRGYISRIMIQRAKLSFGSPLLFLSLDLQIFDSGKRIGEPKLSLVLQIIIQQN